MTRISVKEQYDNKDVVTQIYRLKDHDKDVFEDLARLHRDKQSVLNSAQLQAVNSTITLAKVTTYDGYQAQIDAKQPIGEYVTEEHLQEELDTKQDVGDYATRTELANGLAAKQPIGDYATRTELAQKQPLGDYATNTALSQGLATKQNTLTWDTAPAQGSLNPVTSNGIYQVVGNVETAINTIRGII